MKPLWSSRPRSERPVAIVDVTVIPMDRPGTIPHRTVVIENGRIRAIGPAEEIDTAGFDVVDGTGRFLLPGLADMHVHFWDTSECGMFLANGVTTVRNMWGAPLHLAYQRAYDAGTFAGPRLFTTSPIVDGLGPTGSTMWPGSTPLADPGDAREMVEGFVERGYQQIKAYSWLAPAALRALGDASAATGLPLGGHCPNEVSLEEAIEAGQTCFEHLTNVARNRLRPDAEEAVRARRAEVGLRAMGDPLVLNLMVDGMDFDSVRRVAASMAEREVWNCPTLVVMQQIFQDPATAMTDERNKYQDLETLRSWDPANDFRFRDATEPLEVRLAAARRRDEMSLAIVRVLHEEGAPLLIGTDTPNPFVHQGFTVHDELRNFVDAGFTPYEALRCATADPARFMGETDWGTVAVGQRAELLLVAADPLVDIAAVSDIDAVFVNGRHFNREDLQQMLSDRLEAVQPGGEVVAAELVQPPSNNVTLSEGQMVEQLAGAPVGGVRYRCCAGPADARVVEEVHAARAREKRSRVWLTSEGWLERGEVVRTFPVGEQHVTAEWSEEGDGYVVETVDVDGWRSQNMVGGGRMLPDNHFSEFAAALSGIEGDDLRALSLDDEGSVIPISVSRSGSTVQVAFKRDNGSTEHLFTIEGDQIVQSRTLTWQGERVVELADSEAEPHT